MGYTGCSVLADALEGALGRSETRLETLVRGPAETSWTDEALEELAQVPPFLRGRARRLAEAHARELDSEEVTREIFLQSRD